MFNWGSKDVKLATFDVLVFGSRLWSLVGVERVFDLERLRVLARRTRGACRDADLVEELVVINYSESN